MIKPVSPNAAPKAVPVDAVSINDDNRVFNIMLPIRDGLMVCFKNE